MVEHRYGVGSVSWTVLGEGAMTGVPAVEVFFTDCNLWDGHPLHRTQGLGPCAHWCTADFIGGDVLTEEQLVGQVAKEWTGGGGNEAPCWVWLTGGEPCLQLTRELVHSLHDAGFRVGLETNGTIFNKALALVDHVCLSPKHETAWRTAMDFDIAELKVVLPGCVPSGRSNGWTDEELYNMTPLVCERYVQPQDVILVDEPLQTVLCYDEAAIEDIDESTLQYARLLYRLHLDRCLAWVKKHPSWKVSFQAQRSVGL